MKPRILLVTDSYPPLIGGATRAIQMLGHELVRRGYAVCVATAWQVGVAETEDDQGVLVHRLRDLTSRVRWISSDPNRHTPPPFPDLEAVWRFRRLLNQFRPDMVHAYGWLSYSCAAAMRGSGVPLILSARDYGNICPKRTLVRNDRICSGPGWAKCLQCAMGFYGIPKGAVSVVGVLGGRRSLSRKMWSLHSVSTYVQALMDRCLHPSDSAIRVVIPDFRDDSREEHADKDILAQLPGEPFILFVGALRRIKGIEQLIAAYGKLDNPPPLVLIGTPAPDTPHAFPDGVVVLKSAPHATVMAAWDRAIFGVAPSILPEPLGNVVHEAMSRGRPVIGTTPGGHADMIEDGRSGFLVPAGDVEALANAMRTLIGDGALRERMGLASRARAAEFTLAAVMPQFEALYERVYARAMKGKL